MVLEKSILKLFDEMFEVGEELVFIDIFDRFTVGVLKETDEYNCYVQLLRSNSESLRRVPWADIRFISHDGFPVSRLRGADGSALIEKLDGQQDKIRQALTVSACKNCGSLFSDNHLHQQTICPYCPGEIDGQLGCPYEVRTHHVGGSWNSGGSYTGVAGDPFEFKAVSAYLVNAGSDQNSQTFRDNPLLEECLVMTAKDGARAQLYDLTTVYFFEGGQ